MGVLTLTRREAERSKLIARSNKYQAEIQVVDGFTFRSGLEARYYGLCKMREKAHEISALVIHPEFRLHVDGEEVGHYEADFSFRDHRSNSFVVVDTKSEPTRTDLYRWKKKHFEIEYGIRITEVEHL